MKKYLALFSLILFSCKKPAVEKPQNLIDEPVMVAMLYDLTVLEAIKSHAISNGTTSPMQTNEYLYKKYGVDSLQFVQNEKYYASNITTYKRIFDQVNQRILDSLAYKKESQSTTIKTDRAPDAELEQSH